MLSNTVTIRLPPDAVKKIEKHAESAKLPFSTWIRVTVLNHLDALEEKGKEGMDTPPRESIPTLENTHTQTAQRRRS